MAILEVTFGMENWAKNLEKLTFALADDNLISLTALCKGNGISQKYGTVIAMCVYKEADISLIFDEKAILQPTTGEYFSGPRHFILLKGWPRKFLQAKEVIWKLKSTKIRAVLNYISRN